MMKRIVAVASGKGGVGKSTVAVNLAATLANKETAPESSGPLRVALVDVDFYGPSIPTLMGGGEIAMNHQEQIVPASRYGLKYISIGFFLKNPDDPVIWRGPMFSKAIQQLFEDTDWGDIDICIVDMPPGTGDAQLSLSQQVKLSGAIVVTTPQELALTDVRRAINMFRTVKVPVLGVVENMCGFSTPSGERIDIFGRGGGQTLSKAYDLPYLGEIPIVPSIRESGDEGRPAVFRDDSGVRETFRSIAAALLEQIERVELSQADVKISN